jgi:hypothetical protein
MEIRRAKVIQCPTTLHRTFLLTNPIEEDILVEREQKGVEQGK